MRGDADPRWDLFDACVDIARRSWPGDSTNGTTLSHAGIQEFLRDSHALAARSGDLDMNLMYLEGRPIGFLYNYGRDGYVGGLRSGYDPEFAPLGVGTTMIATFIRELIQSDNHTLDLGPGYLDKKRPWLSHVARSHRFAHYSAATPRTQLLRWNRWLVERRNHLPRAEPVA